MSLARSDRSDALPKVHASGLARQAHLALLLELRTWPKPGLVSHRDSGAHHDMDAALFRRSAKAIAPFFSDLAAAGADHVEMGRLREIGLEAEFAMMAATGNVNTHRGAIFGLGLLVAAAGRAAAGSVASGESLGDTVRRCWGHSILQGPTPLRSHGSAARRRYGAGGARNQAALGFPAVYGVGLPSLAVGRALSGGDEHAARVHACFALIAALDDTNLLHRGGAEGLAFAQASTRDFIESGGVGAPDWRIQAARIHTGFVQRGLSPGGSADLLAMSLFVERSEAV